VILPKIQFSLTFGKRSSGGRRIVKKRKKKCFRCQKGGQKNQHEERGERGAISEARKVAAEKSNPFPLDTSSPRGRGGDAIKKNFGIHLKSNLEKGRKLVEQRRKKKRRHQRREEGALKPKNLTKKGKRGKKRLYFQEISKNR